MKAGACIWLDCDTGSDDAMALMMLLQAHERNEINLTGVSCVKGNTSLRNATMNNLRLLKLFGQLETVPLHMGCSKELITLDEPAVLAENVHGADGLGGKPEFDPPASAELMSYVREEHAAMAIIGASKRHGKQLKLVATGPLTNLALAVTLDPDLPSRIQALYIMGGTSRGQGNVTADAEFNFYQDPHAARITLQSFTAGGCNVHIVDWELCLDHALQLDWYDQWMADVRTARKAFLKMALGALYQFSLQEGEPGVAENSIIIADPYCVAVLLHPELGLEPRQVSISVGLGTSLPTGACVVKNFGKMDGVSETSCYGPVTLYSGFDLEKYKSFLLAEFPQ